MSADHIPSVLTSSVQNPPLLQKATNCYNSKLQPAPKTPPQPLPDPTDAPEQFLATHTKPLTPQQQAAIDLLIAGRSDAAVAYAIGAHRVTVTRWRLYNHVFQAELNRRRIETWGAAADRLRATLSKAVRVFQKQIQSKDDDLAFRAARALLHLAGSSRLVRPPDPALAPPDPVDVLNLEARKIRIEQSAIDPKIDPLDDEHRALALRRLLHKNAINPVPEPQAGNPPHFPHNPPQGEPASAGRSPPESQP